MKLSPENSWATRYIDLLNEKYGGQALYTSDDFFAEKDNLVKNTQPIFIEDKYTDRGKWMDGWESRRRRDGGYDWCVLRLGLPGVIKAVDVDTTHFRGNAPASIKIEACVSADDPNDDTEWTEILPEIAVEPNSSNVFEVLNQDHWTHLRLNIYPDGGVARLRVYGQPYVDWSRFLPGELIDLSSTINGGQALECSDMFFSSMHNLLAPGRGKNMGDGWETKRRRGPGYDWVVIQLGHKGCIKKLKIDTNHFKGNYPDRFSLEACVSDTQEFYHTNAEWKCILPETKLYAHREHLFQDELLDKDTEFTHVRLNIYPDGGVSRMRIYGYPTTKDSIQAKNTITAVMDMQDFNTLSREEQHTQLLQCCVSERWINTMLDSLPFATKDDMLNSADSIWRALNEEDYLQAFEGHPQIGDVSTLKKKYQSTKALAAGEQSGVDTASDNVIQELAEGNKAYLEKFGFIFIVCATGKSAQQMLTLLQARLPNTREQELQNAAEEQRKITRIRLDKLINS